MPKPDLQTIPEWLGTWQPIETYPKDGEQFLVTDGDSVIMAEAPDGDLIIHDITSVAEIMVDYHVHTQTHFFMKGLTHEKFSFVGCKRNTCGGMRV